MKKYYITTPIYYVNDVPHIGHVFTTVVADFIAKMKKLLGYDTYFLTGTDEHGQKAERAAKKLTITPKEMADKVVENYYKLWEQLNIDYSDFIRTTETRHIKGAIKFFERVMEKQDIYKGFYEGWYCWSCEAFWTETGPENTCPDCGKLVEKTKEASYFFRLTKYQDRLLAYYKEHPDFIKPQGRHNEVVKFVESGLKDLSISRTSVRWGVPVPHDPDHIIYVWFDALSNYITALNWDEEGELYTKYWPADLHLVGKDIVRFHCVYWPAFLMSAGLPLPRTIFGHGWWMMNSAKMSKTLGNVLKPEPLLKILGCDPVRYFLLREAPIETDCDISLESIVARLNADLANDYGNLISRTFQMATKFFNGILTKRPVLGASETHILDEFNSLKNDLDLLCTTINLQEIFKRIWHIIYLLNRYIDENQPWAAIKLPEKKDAVEGNLYFVCDFIRILSVLLYPAIPESSKKVIESFGMTIKDINATQLEYGLLPLGFELPKPIILFPRLDIKEIQNAHQIE